MTSTEESLKEFQKTRDRIGTNAAEAMAWILRFAQNPLERLSAGDFINLSAEMEMFSKYGATVNKPFALVEDQHIHCGSKKVQPLTKVEMTQLQAFALERLHELTKNHYSTFQFGNFRLMTLSFPGRDWSFMTPIVQTRKEGFAYHLAQLIGELGHRVGKCPECHRLFLAIRLHQKFCSPRCRSRAGTREFRKAQAKGTSKKMK